MNFLAFSLYNRKLYRAESTSANSAQSAIISTGYANLHERNTISHENNKLPSSNFCLRSTYFKGNSNIKTYIQQRLKYFMGLGRYMAKELMKEIGNKSREFFEFVSPPVDIVEDGNELLVVADLAGFNKKDITLKINDSTLSISATREPIEHAGSSYWQQRPLKIEKKIHLPVKIKEGEEALGRAKYANGMLEIRIPISGGGMIKIE